MGTKATENMYSQLVDKRILSYTKSATNFFFLIKLRKSTKIFKIVVVTCLINTLNNNNG